MIISTISKIISSLEIKIDKDLKETKIKVIITFREKMIRDNMKIKIK